MLRSTGMPTYIRSALLAVSVLGLAFGCSGTVKNGGNVDAGAAKGCVDDSDCGLGEIDHEILSRSDCLCLFGCVFLPLSKVTIARRQSQYDARCDPRLDGKGNPCPVDDCAVPPTPACVAGQCGFSHDGAP